MAEGDVRSMSSVLVGKNGRARIGLYLAEEERSCGVADIPEERPIYQQRRQAVECIEPINKKNI